MSEQTELEKAIEEANQSLEHNWLLPCSIATHLINASQNTAKQLSALEAKCAEMGDALKQCFECRHEADKINIICTFVLSNSTCGQNYIHKEKVKTDTEIVGPNPCSKCGGDYGEHLPNCAVATKQTNTPRTAGVKFAVSIFEHGKFIRHQTVTTVEHAETLERELDQVRLNFAKEVDRGQAFINRIKEENRQLTTRTEQAEAELNQVIETCNKCEAECLGYATASQQAESKLAEVERERDELGTMTDHLLAHCKDSECEVCSKIVCPHKDDMHFHHDGCPSCVGYEQLIEQRNQLLTDIKVAVDKSLQIREHGGPGLDGSPADKEYYLALDILSTPSAKQVLSSPQPPNP